jgi:hypothetical protein
MSADGLPLGKAFTLGFLYAAAPSPPPPVAPTLRSRVELMPRANVIKSCRPPDEGSLSEFRLGIRRRNGSLLRADNKKRGAAIDSTFADQPPPIACSTPATLPIGTTLSRLFGLSRAQLDRADSADGGDGAIGIAAADDRGAGFGRRA